MKPISYRTNADFLRHGSEVRAAIERAPLNADVRDTHEKRGTIRMGVKLPKGLIAKLDDMARRNCVSRAAVIRWCL